MSSRSLFLTLLILVVAAVGWMLVRDVAPESTPEAAVPQHAATPLVAELGEAELVAPETRTAVESPLPATEPEPQALVDGIIEPPEPPLPDFAARYAGMPKKELEVRSQLLQKRLRELTHEVHEQNFATGQYETKILAAGEAYVNRSGHDSSVRPRGRSDGTSIYEISFVDTITHPRTAAMRAEIDWLNVTVNDNTALRR